VLDSSDDYVTEELVKQKRRLKEISSALDTQHLLLRLIVQVRLHAPLMLPFIQYF
jgi:transient receptor potential cation channel subfamily A protein 1